MRWLVVLLCLASVPAWACEVETKKAIEVVKALPTMDELSAVVAYEEVVCAETPHVKNIVLRAGLTSSHRLVQSMALSEALMEKETIAIKRGDELLSYPVNFVDRKNNCVSLYSSGGCERERLIMIEGVRAVLVYREIVGEFTLNDSGNLVGQLSDGNKRDEATIILNER